MTFLSINRFERKKRIDLAVHALKKLKSLPLVNQPQLIIAGGYDERIDENKQVFEELKDLVQRLELEQSVYFIKSFTDRQKELLFAAVVGVVYTPPDEHFGIVPLESMAYERPVVACNSGGPVESIVDGETGFLAEPNAESFASSMQKLLESHNENPRQMGKLGRKRVQENFSRALFGQKLGEWLTDLVQKKEN